MLHFLREARPPNTSPMPQNKETGQLKTQRLDDTSDPDIIYPEVPTPPHFPGDINHHNNTIQNTPAISLRKPNEYWSVSKSQARFSTKKDQEPLAILLGTHEPTVSTSAGTSSTISCNMNSPGKINTKGVTQFDYKLDSGKNKSFKTKALDGQISRGLLSGVQTFFSFLLNNDTALYGLSLFIFPYLAYIYISTSSLIVLAAIILFICCLFKFSKFLISQYLPVSPLNSSFLRCLQSYSILDVILAFGYLKYLVFYLSRLYLLAFVELSPAERTMIFQDWDPRMDKIVKTRLIEFIPNFLRRFMDSEGPQPLGALNSPHITQDIQLENEQNLDEFNSEINDVYYSRHSELLTTPYVEVKPTIAVNAWQPTVGNCNNNAELIPLQLSTSNLRSLPKTRSNFIPIVTQIILRRLLFHPQIENFLYKFKLRLHHIFSILAGISLILYSPIARRVSKKLPIGFFIFSILSFYFYLLSHDWPKFLRYREKTKNKNKSLPQNFSHSPRSSRCSSENDLPRTTTIEDAWSDIIVEFTRRHTALPKIN